MEYVEDVTHIYILYAEACDGLAKLILKSDDYEKTCHNKIKKHKIDVMPEENDMFYQVDDNHFFYQVNDIALLLIKTFYMFPKMAIEYDDTISYIPNLILRDQSFDNKAFGII